MGLVLDQRSNITGTLRNKIQVKEKKSEHGDWRLLKDRITRGHRYYCTLAQCVNYQITKTRYTWVIPGSSNSSYLPGVNRSSLDRPTCASQQWDYQKYSVQIRHILSYNGCLYSLPLLSPHKIYLVKNSS